MRIGIDLGGTKISAVALADDGTERCRRRVSTPAAEGADAIVSSISALVLELEQECGEQGSVGIGTPGAISPHTSLMKNSNTTCLNGLPVRAMLEEALQRQVRIANDANCFALSEAVDGAGANADSLFGVIVGTGTGGALVVNKHVLRGRNAVAGEWGHNPLPWASDEELAATHCYCGKRGCIETYLSGPGLAELHWRMAGVCAKPEQIADAAFLGDEKAEQSLQAYEDAMARSLASIINVFDPDVIVLGGGLSKLDRLYENVPKRWGEYVFSDHVATQLLKPVHGDDSGVRGLLGFGIENS